MRGELIEIWTAPDAAAEMRPAARAELEGIALNHLVGRELLVGGSGCAA